MIRQTTENISDVKNINNNDRDGVETVLTTRFRKATGNHLNLRVNID